MRYDNGYAYAKACGIIGKSFLGARISLLSGLRTLSDMEKLVFSDNKKEYGGNSILAGLEKRITDRAVRRILSVVGSYMDPPELLVCMLRGFEYAGLKECLSASSLGKKDAPAVSDIGRFRTIRYNEYPDAAAMLKNTEYKSLLSDDLIKQGKNFTDIEVKLDYHYYKNLIESLFYLSGSDRYAAQRLLCDEISLRNCLWALRLRSYYEKNETDTASYLMDFNLSKSGSQKKLTSDAAASLKFHLDMRRQWDGWKWEKFLNKEDSSHDGKHWIADPRYFQNSVSRYLYRLALHGFHSEPLTVSAIYCFIKLVQFEEDLLFSAAQGLALGLDSAAVIKMIMQGD